MYADEQGWGPLAGTGGNRDATEGTPFGNVRWRIEQVLPEAATRYVASVMDLERRSKSYDAKVGAYALAMARGQWRLNGEPLIFSEGRLVAGLARCMACARSGAPFRTVIVDGVPAGVIPTLDSHLKRTAGDVLGVNGEAFPVALASACQVVASYLNAEDRSRFRTHRGTSLTAQEIEAIVEGDPGFRESAQVVAGLGATRSLSHGLATACHRLMALSDRARADEFMMVVGDPSLAPGSPPAVLAGRLDSLREEGASPVTFRLALVAKAWNRFLAGTPLSAHGFTFAGVTETRRLGTEAFPCFQGVPDDARIDVASLVDGRTEPEAAEGGAGEGVRVEVVEVDPRMAARLLARNGPGGAGNRPIRAKHVDQLSRDMSGRRFLLNGETVKIGVSGAVLDGQHRLSACVHSKTPFWTLVAYDVDDGCFATFDTGRRQGLGVKLRKEGHGYAFQTSAAAGMLWRILRDRETGDPTTMEARELLEQHPGLADSARRVPSCKAVLQGSVAAPLHYLFGKADAAAADRFIDDLAHGAGLGRGDPVHTLRERLIKQNRRSGYSDLGDRTRMGIRSWNARREGRSLEKISGAGGPGYPPIV